MLSVVVASMTLLSSPSTTAKSDQTVGSVVLDSGSVADVTGDTRVQDTSPIAEVAQLDERCITAQRLYVERIEAKQGVEFGEDEWTELLDGYNACIDAGVVNEDMRAAVEWAVECAVVAGVNPGCPVSKRNPSIPPPAELKRPQASYTAPQQTQAGPPKSQESITVEEYSPPGFWTGGWHGLVWPWRFTASFFTNVDVWADDNVGILYAIGYILGLIFCVPVGVSLVIGIFNREW